MIRLEGYLWRSDPLNPLSPVTLFYPPHRSWYHLALPSSRLGRSMACSLHSAILFVLFATTLVTTHGQGEYYYLFFSSSSSGPELIRGHVQETEEKRGQWRRRGWWSIEYGGGESWWSHWSCVWSANAAPPSLVPPCLAVSASIANFPTSPLAFALLFPSHAIVLLAPFKPSLYQWFLSSDCKKLFNYQ